MQDLCEKRKRYIILSMKNESAVKYNDSFDFCMVDRWNFTAEITIHQEENLRMVEGKHDGRYKSGIR